MGIRTFKDHPDWSPQQCLVELRSRITDAIKVPGAGCRGVVVVMRSGRWARGAWGQRPKVGGRGRVSVCVAACVCLSACTLAALPPQQHPPWAHPAQSYHEQHGLAVPSSILDVGCSTGISTRWLAEQFPAAQVGRPAVRLLCLLRLLRRIMYRTDVYF